MRLLSNLLVFVVLAGLFALAANDWRVPWAKPPAHGADWCEAHQVELSKCERCNAQIARGGTFSTREREPKEGECPNTLVRVTLGPGAAEQAGLEVATIESRPVSETIRASGEAEYVPTLYARVAPRVAGVVREVKTTLGQTVAAGDVLAVVESAEFGNAKTNLLQALAVLALRQQSHDRIAPLLEKGAIPEKEVFEAKQALDEAKLSLRSLEQRLTLFGLPPQDVQAVGDRGDTSPLLPLAAPFGGVVVEASAVPGETATPERPIFAIADMARMWIAIDVHEADLPRVQTGQKVSFTVDGLPGQRFPGQVAAIGGEVDDRTRTCHVYADVKNVQGLLRAHMFGKAEIRVKPAEPKTLVPKAAVQHDGDCYLVFVRTSKDTYKARKIGIGAVYEGGYEVLEGIAAGETVVTTGSFLLKTEVLRGQMGAG